MVRDRNTALHVAAVIAASIPHSQNSLSAEVAVERVRGVLEQMEMKGLIEAGMFPAPTPAGVDARESSEASPGTGTSSTTATQGRPNQAAQQ